MTVTQTSEFKELIETYGKYISLKVDINAQDGTSYSITAEKIRSAKLHFDGQLFTAVMRCFDFTLEGDYRAIKKGSYIYPTFAVSNLKIERRIKYGRFEVAENPEYDEDANTTKFICYDAMFSTVKPFALTADELENAKTLSGLLTVIAEKCGFDINNINDLKNANRAVDPAAYLVSGNDSGAEYTFRDVLDEIARCAGCSFCFKSDANGNVCSSKGKPSLYIVYVTDGSGNMKHLKDENGADVILDISNFKSLRINEHYGTINSVIFSRQPQEDNVVRYAEGVDESTAVSVKLKQPEMADSDDDTERAAWLDNILPAVNGLRYYCVDFESFGIGYLNFGDVFTIKAYKRDGDGNYDYGSPEGFTTVFMRTEMTIDTDVKESVKLEMPEATSTDYSAATTAEEKAIRQTFLRVDKKLGEIRGLISDTEKGLKNELNATASGFDAKITDTKNNLQTQISANAEGISAAMSSVETVDGKVSDVSKELETLNQTLDEFDLEQAVKTEVTKHTTITAIAGQVSSEISGTYVTTTDFNTTLGDYAKTSALDDYAKKTDLPDTSSFVLKTTYSSYVNQTDKKIESAVNRVSTLESAGYITTAEAQGLITTESDRISLYVTESIKGRSVNLLNNSACFKGNTIYKINSTVTNDFIPTPPADISEEELAAVPSNEVRYIGIKTTASNVTNGFWFKPADLIGQEEGSIDKIKLNTKYTLTFWAKNPIQNESYPNYELSRSHFINPGNGTNVVYDESKSSKLYISNEWTKYTLVFKITSGTISTFALRFFVTTHTPKDTERHIMISSFKLEQGEIDTDWTPSTADTEKSTEARLSVYVKHDEYNAANIVSYIEAYADVIDLSANTLIFNQGAFALNAQGYITSTGGTIGGWNIKDTCLYSDYGDYRAYLQTPTSSDQWIFSTQTKASNGSYKGTFLVTASGTVRTNQITDINEFSLVAKNSDGHHVFGYGAYDNNLITLYMGGSNYCLRTKGKEIKLESTVEGSSRTNFKIGGTMWGSSYCDHIVSAGDFIISANNSKNSITLGATKTDVYGILTVGKTLNVSEGLTVGGNINSNGTLGFHHKGTLIAGFNSQSMDDVTGSGSTQKESWACFGSNNYKTQIRGAMVYANKVLVAKIEASSTQEVKTNISETQSVLDLFEPVNSTIYSYNYIPESTADSSSDGELSADSVDEIELEDNDTCYGFVIGDGYAVPDEVISASGDSINLYSMASINWKATQELYAALMNTQKKISELENQINGGN